MTTVHPHLDENLERERVEASRPAQAAVMVDPAELKKVEDAKKREEMMHSHNLPGPHP